MRSNFPVLNSCIYFNNAYAGPISISLSEHRKKIEKKLLKDVDGFKIDNPIRIKKYQKTISSFVNSKEENTFLTPNFSTGYRYILDMLPISSKILALENDYDSIIAGLEERNFNVDYLPITSDFETQIKNKLQEKKYTVIILSIVQYISGILVDFDALNKIKSKYTNLIIIGDSTQFLGADHFDFGNSPFDVVIGSGYKWMLAGFGNAYIIISENFLEKTGNKLHLISQKIYAGHNNILSYSSLNYMIKFLIKNDFSSLIKLKNNLNDKLKYELDIIGLLDPIIKKRKHHSSIYNIGGDKKLFANLQSAGIRCSFRGNGIRISAHFYNTYREVDYLIKNLKKSY